MARLVPCAQCKRHVFTGETTCPHCGKPAGAMLIAAAVSAGLALAGCGEPPPITAVYGPPPISTDDRTPTTSAPAPTDAPTAAPTSTSAVGAPTSSATSSATTQVSAQPVPMPVYGPPPVDPGKRAPK